MFLFFWNVDINYTLLYWKGEIQILNFFWREILTLHLWEGLEPFGRAMKGSILNAAREENDIKSVLWLVTIQDLKFG